ncbi:MAG: nucleotidyltransferase family protein [Actinomycetia bacterium]|nr:nucleotidyltransferase family protein [Actinomycetes bacterium]MCP4084400.1 nucleotidyltransferase family protein [Actinomycetes bacterium]
MGLARSHRLTPHVGHNLNRSESVPDDVRPAFEQMVAFTTHRGLVSARALHKITESLADSGIPSLPMKGPALSAWLYGDWGRRVFVDLDVLVDREDVGRPWRSWSRSASVRSTPGTSSPPRRRPSPTGSSMCTTLLAGTRS